MDDKLEKAVEEVLTFLKHIGLSKDEALVVVTYTKKSLEIDKLKETIKKEILAELKQ